jgi:hypothetical protein
VRNRVKLRVKIKAVLTYEGLKLPSDSGLFTRKGVEWLHGLNLPPVESYLHVIETLNDEITILSKELARMAEDDEDVKLLTTGQNNVPHPTLPTHHAFHSLSRHKHTENRQSKKHQTLHKLISPQVALKQSVTNHITIGTLIMYTGNNC